MYKDAANVAVSKETAMWYHTPAVSVAAVVSTTTLDDDPIRLHCNVTASVLSFLNSNTPPEELKYELKKTLNDPIASNFAHTETVPVLVSYVLVPRLLRYVAPSKSPALVSSGADGGSWFNSVPLKSMYSMETSPGLYTSPRAQPVDRGHIDRLHQDARAVVEPDLGERAAVAVIKRQPRLQRGQQTLGGEPRPDGHVHEGAAHIPPVPGLRVQVREAPLHACDVRARHVGPGRDHPRRRRRGTLRHRPRHRERRAGAQIGPRVPVGGRAAQVDGGRAPRRQAPVRAQRDRDPCRRNELAAVGLHAQVDVLPRRVHLRHAAVEREVPVGGDPDRVYGLVPRDVDGHALPVREPHVVTDAHVGRRDRQVPADHDVHPLQRRDGGCRRHRQGVLVGDPAADLDLLVRVQPHVQVLVGEVVVRAEQPGVVGQRVELHPHRQRPRLRQVRGGARAVQVGGAVEVDRLGHVGGRRRRPGRRDAAEGLGGHQPRLVLHLQPEVVRRARGQPGPQHARPR
eukprot:scaffold39859_cov11-Prasinocladus_malaysianus.AAC.1